MSYQQENNSRPRSVDRGFNLNSVFLTILLAVSGWTLNKVIAYGETNAQQISNNIEFRTRLANIEVQLQTNTIAVTRLESERRSERRFESSPGSH